MTFHSLGKIASVTPGTIVRVSLTSVKCARIQFAVDPDNTGKVYLGGPNLNATTKVGLARTFTTPSAGPQDGMPVPPMPGGLNVHDLADYWIDAAVATNGVLVGYWVA